MLRCPECYVGSLYSKMGAIQCENCEKIYPLSFSNRPILLREDNRLFTTSDYIHCASKGSQNVILKKFIPTISVNLSVAKALNILRDHLDLYGPSNILVVGGGSQRSWLDPILTRSVPHQVIYTDIDSSADVDIFCDGHELPFKDCSIDAVITTAVLEHVLYPETVAREISRVLRLEGFLYSEMPFMQQVHEGAYDFTRYTLSGHRRLFNNFSEIDSGMVAGPATALIWAIENFYLSFFSKKINRNIVKIIVRLSLFWLKYFDYYLKNNFSAMDGASCTYILGKKEEKLIEDLEIIRNYIGSKDLNHV